MNNPAACTYLCLDLGKTRPLVSNFHLKSLDTLRAREVVLLYISDTCQHSREFQRPEQTLDVERIRVTYMAYLAVGNTMSTGIQEKLCHFLCPCPLFVFRS